MKYPGLAGSGWSKMGAIHRSRTQRLIDRLPFSFGLHFGRRPTYNWQKFCAESQRVAMLRDQFALRAHRAKFLHRAVRFARQRCAISGFNAKRDKRVKKDTKVPF